MSVDAGSLPAVLHAAARRHSTNSGFYHLDTEFTGPLLVHVGLIDAAGNIILNVVVEHGKGVKDLMTEVSTENARKIREECDFQMAENDNRGDTSEGAAEQCGGI